jgi:hypothetical protein
VYGKAVDDHGALTVEVGKVEVLGEKMAGLLPVWDLKINTGQFF